MSQESLDVAEFRTAIDEVGRKRVSECVWRHVDVQARALYVAFDDQPEPLTGQPVPAMV